jgi:hypothetical protein
MHNVKKLRSKIAMLAVLAVSVIALIFVAVGTTQPDSNSGTPLNISAGDLANLHHAGISVSPPTGQAAVSAEVAIQTVQGKFPSSAIGGAALADCQDNVAVNQLCWVVSVDPRAEGFHSHPPPGIAPTPATYMYSLVDAQTGALLVTVYGAAGP